ncbi:hypothetical protein CLV78_102403 [Aliiruegeria haliotis]|uniref:DNA repair protein n=1 Tax=Aliiruegeria haliotis TaxID=1280846 RepID=A0A2T0RVK1_9RHOB|nr:DNA repair protein [Aliiruegeria haliotis]PRY25226.1 hypothetical protein CLV78_102403 [Aliiruegeria haliotis]
MTHSQTPGSGHLTAFAQTISLALIVMFASMMAGLTMLSAAGMMPWLQVSAGFGNAPSPYAGMAVQITLTLFAIALCFFVPTNRRVRQLEDSHREFHITMDDVERAYAAAHAQDRSGAFKLSSEFDSVRERLLFLRDHPDLRSLEPDVLEVAAQMSATSRDLAKIYSDEKIERARTFLRQRQEEAEAFDERLTMVHHTLDEIKRWDQQLNVEEAVRQKQLDTLEKDLFEMLPMLGYEVGVEKIDPRVLEAQVATSKPNVVPIAPKVGSSSGNTTP